MTPFLPFFIALASGIGASIGTFVSQRLLEVYKLRDALRIEAQRARIQALAKVFAAIYAYRERFHRLIMDMSANKETAALLVEVNRLFDTMSETVERERFPLGETLHRQARHCVTEEYWRKEGHLSNEPARRLDALTKDEEAQKLLNGLHHLAGVVDPLREPSRYPYALSDETNPPPIKLKE